MYWIKCTISGFFSFKSLNLGLVFSKYTIGCSPKYCFIHIYIVTLNCDIKRVPYYSQFCSPLDRVKISNCSYTMYNTMIPTSKIQGCVTIFSKSNYKFLRDFCDLPIRYHLNGMPFLPSSYQLRW